MAVKVCLDAGHYGYYNRCPSKDPVLSTYWESKFTWTFHNFLADELKAYGIEVVKTRADQTKDLGLEARGKKAQGCDLFLSIHSNALGSGTMYETTDYPLACCTVTHKADALGDKLAKAVETTIGTVQPARRINKVGSSNQDWYGVLRGATSVGVPAILLEHGFHTNSKCVRWLLDNDHLKNLAAAEAKIIAEHFGIKEKTGSSTSTTPATTQPNNPTTSFLVKVICSELNVRKDAGVEYPITTKIHKNEVYTIVETKKAKDGGTWGLLKSKIGWINIGSSFVKKV